LLARLHGHAAGAGPRPVPDDCVRPRPAAAHRALPPAAACQSKVSGWVSGPGTLTCAGVRGVLRAARPLQRGRCWCAGAGVPSRVSAARIIPTVYIHSIRLGQKQHTPSAPNAYCRAVRTQGRQRARRFLAPSAPTAVLCTLKVGRATAGSWLPAHLLPCCAHSGSAARPQVPGRPALPEGAGGGPGHQHERRRRLCARRPRRRGRGGARRRRAAHGGGRRCRGRRRRRRRAPASGGAPRGAAQPRAGGAATRRASCCAIIVRCLHAMPSHQPAFALSAWLPCGGGTSRCLTRAQAGCMCTVQLAPLGAARSLCRSSM